MKSLFLKIGQLNIFIKTTIYSALLSLVLFILLIPLMFLSYPDIPLGFIVGALIGCLGYLFVGLVKKDDEHLKKYTAKIITILTIRLIVLIIAMIISAYCYYSLHWHYLNVFTMIGGYFIPLIVLISLYLLERRKNGFIR